jgi:hypothetical protein
MACNQPLLPPPRWERSCNLSPWEALPGKWDGNICRWKKLRKRIGRQSGHHGFAWRRSKPWNPKSGQAFLSASSSFPKITVKLYPSRDQKDPLVCLILFSESYCKYGEKEELAIFGHEQK